MAASVHASARNSRARRRSATLPPFPMRRGWSRGVTLAG
jgi:hypothetical protein